MSVLGILIFFTVLLVIPISLKKRSFHVFIFCFACLTIPFALIMLLVSLIPIFNSNAFEIWCFRTYFRQLPLQYLGGVVSILLSYVYIHKKSQEPDNEPYWSNNRYRWCNTKIKCRRTYTAIAYWVLFIYTASIFWGLLKVCNS